MSNFNARVNHDTRKKLRLLALNHGTTLGGAIDLIAQANLDGIKYETGLSRDDEVFLRADVNESTKRKIAALRIEHSATTEEILLALAGDRRVGA